MFSSLKLTIVAIRLDAALDIVWSERCKITDRFSLSELVIKKQMNSLCFNVK